MSGDKAKPVTHGALRKMLWKFIGALNERLATELAPVRDLEARVQSLERESEQREYQGVWRPDFEYLKHNAATFDGGMWLCRVDRTTQKPAEGDDWQLAVRRGRDART